MTITYKDAGVDIEKGDLLVAKIKEKVKSTYNNRVKAGVGGFSCLYEAGDKYLAAGTDGVGTKLKLAFELGIHNTIGIDLVAMCVNDIMCTGARPLFFMDYLACGKLDVEVSEQIISGVVEGCLQSECALIGGETAEMPGMYSDGEYDLAGFSVGEVEKTRVIDGSNVSEGDTLIGLASSGFHSNGYSLVRRLLKEDEVELKKKCLTPTRIYWKSIKDTLNELSGLAHITGGGFDNIARINKNFNYEISNLEFLKDMPEYMTQVIERSGLSNEELFKTFNMGIGLVLVTSNPDKVLESLETNGEKPYLLGRVVSGSGKINLNF